MKLLFLLLIPALSQGAIQMMYDFEKDLGGWGGKVSLSTSGASGGKKALAIDATAASGWNQDLAVNLKNLDYMEGLELMMEVTLPQGTIASAEFIEFSPIFSGALNNWYPIGKVQLKDGRNNISIPFDGAKVGTPAKFHLVLNSGKTIPGPVYVDSIRIKKPGKPGTLKVRLRDAKGKAVAGAHVAFGKQSAVSDTKGMANFKMPADKYKGEVLGEGIAPLKFEALLKEAKSVSLDLKVTRVPRPAMKPGRISVNAAETLLSFDSHKIYGHNMANWNGLDPFVSPIQVKKLQDVHGMLIRIPGGGYGNHWNWKDGTLYNHDGTPNWKPEGDWPAFVKFFQNLGPQSEAMLIANIFMMTPQDTVDWISDARAKGVQVRYVELGNEPDIDPKIAHQGKDAFWTEVENYVSVYVPFAQAIRKAHPDIKILGPCISQLVSRECPGKQAWECERSENEHWIEKFLRLVSKKGDLVDGLSFHSYPFWPGDQGYSAERAFATVDLWKKWLPEYQAWVKQYLPKKAEAMEYALTEYHLQVAENSSTVKRVSGVWHAAYLAEFIKQGGDIATHWDLNTVKAGDGGGHAMLDANNDPTRPYSERAKYWTYKMMARGFTGELVSATAESGELLAWAAKDKGRTSVLIVNKSETQPVKATVAVAGVDGAKQVRVQKLTSMEYEWSEVLFRPFVNVDPTSAATEKTYPVPAADKDGLRTLTPLIEPMSVYLLMFE